MVPRFISLFSSTTESVTLNPAAYLGKRVSMCIAKNSQQFLSLSWVPGPVLSTPCASAHFILKTALLLLPFFRWPQRGEVTCRISACSAACLIPAQLRDSCLISCVISPCSAAWLVPAQDRVRSRLSDVIRVCLATSWQSAQLHDYCLLSCVIPACSASWLLPAELRDSCLLSSMFIACWAARCYWAASAQ